MPAKSSNDTPPALTASMYVILLALIFMREDLFAAVKRQSGAPRR